MKDADIAMEFRESPRRLMVLAVLLVCAILVVIATSHMRDALTSTVVWLGVGLLCWSFGSRIARYVSGKPDVRIDDSGVFDSRSFRSPIPWQQIEVVSVLPRQESLLLFLSNPDYRIPTRFWRRIVIAAADRKQVTLSMRGLSPDIEQAWTFLKTNYRTRALERPGVDPFVVPPGEPFSWPLKMFIEKHVLAHSDTLLMAVATVLNLAVGGFLFVSHTAGIPHFFGFFIFPVCGVFFFLKWNDRYDADRSDFDQMFGFFMQLSIALAPWLFWLTRL